MLESDLRHRPRAPFEAMGYYNFLGIGEGKKKSQNATASVVLQYPFPPKNCDEAVLTVQMLKNNLRAVQEKIAGGKPSAESQAAAQAYEKLIAEFNNWIAQRNCVQTQINEENTAFTQQVLGALNSEAIPGTATANWLLYGGIGVAVIIVLVVIFKK